MQISERVVGDVTIFDLHGRLILDEGFEPLRAALSRAIGEGRRKVLLNFAGVTFLDSAGIGLIACKFVTMCRLNGQLKLCNVCSHSHEVLRTTKLLTVFETFASEADALTSFRSLSVP